MATVFEDKGPAHAGSSTCTFRAEDAAASQEFRKQYESRLNVVHGEDMPFERSADGLIKHIVHRRMNTRECCVEAYMQFLKAGERSGIHRHMWEEIIFVVEGSGYDLHWDLKFDCLDKFEWEWAEELEKIRMEARRLHLYPAVHQPSAFRHRGGAADRDLQPHRQGHGVRLVRPGGERPGVLVSVPDLVGAPLVGALLRRRVYGDAVGGHEGRPYADLDVSCNRTFTSIRPIAGHCATITSPGLTGATPAGEPV